MVLALIELSLRVRNRYTIILLQCTIVMATIELRSVPRQLRIRVLTQ